MNWRFSKGRLLAENKGGVRGSLLVLIMSWLVGHWMLRCYLASFTSCLGFPTMVGMDGGTSDLSMYDMNMVPSGSMDIVLSEKFILVHRNPSL